MSASARASIESLLRARQLDHTLTTALPPLDPHDDHSVAATGIAELDAPLGGGFPRGHLSEIVGARTSGRFTMLMHALAAATARGELVAVVDALDTLDVHSAAAAGLDLDRCLWVRGHVTPYPGLCREANQRALEQALRAFALIAQAGVFGLIAFDIGDAPSEAFRRLPCTTWLRLQRMVEGRPTAMVLVGPAPMARSSAGLTIQLGVQGLGVREGFEKSKGSTGIRFHGRLFDGLDVDARIVSARTNGRRTEDVRVCLSTCAR